MIIVSNSPSSSVAMSFLRRCFIISFLGVRLMMFQIVITAGIAKVTVNKIARNIKPTMVLIILLT